MKNNPDIVIAIDSFKGSLSSIEAGCAAKKGIMRVFPQAKISVRPIADGGEGTTEAIISANGGELKTVEVANPIGKRINAVYGITKNKTAVIETAQAAGITLIEDNEKNPMHTTTYGIGEMIKNAAQNGCRSFIIGLGGSVTNDGGIGMLQALGASFTDKNGCEVPFGAEGVGKISKISLNNMMPQLKECSFNVACDVNNPLCGKNGCSAVFAPQKGATESMVRLMDKYLYDFANLTGSLFPSSSPNLPGSGAAGGLGYAFSVFMGAELKSGIDIVIEETELEKYIKNADIVITGEGKIDNQTAMGKAPGGVARLAKKYGKPLFAFSGAATKDASVCNENGIDAFFPILRSVCSLSEAMEKENAYANLEDTAEQVLRAVKAVSK